MGGFTKLTGLDLPEVTPAEGADTTGYNYYDLELADGGQYFPGEESTTPQPDVRLNIKDK